MPAKSPVLKAAKAAHPVFAPDPEDGPRRVVFRIRKEGPGQAAIAQVVIRNACDW